MKMGATEKGVKFDGGKVRVGLCLEGFARALLHVARVSTFGAQKYTDHGWVSVPRGQERYTDAMLRHYLAEAQGEECDPESGIPHAAHLAWNALARLDLMIRSHEINALTPADSPWLRDLSVPPAMFPPQPEEKKP